MMLDGMATLAATPILRLSLGRFPDRTEVRQFAKGFAAGERVLPPILRGLAEVPAARERVGKLAVLSLVRAGVLRKPADLGPHRIAIPPQAGNPLSYWRGRSFSFLHFEKTAGISVASLLSELFHPLQIDDDTVRAVAPHILSAFLPGQTEQRRQYAFVWGHYDLPALRRLDPARPVIAMLREPRSRILSLYHFWRSVDPELVAGGFWGADVAAAQQLGLLAFLRSDDPLIRNYIENVYARRLTGTYATGVQPDRLEHDADKVLDEAIRALDSLAFAGAAEHTDRILPALGAAIGATLPATLPRHNTADRNHRGNSPGYRKVAREPVTPAIQAELDRLTRLDAVIYRRALARFEAKAEDPPGGSSVTPCSTEITQPAPSQTRPSITVLPSSATTIRL